MQAFHSDTIAALATPPGRSGVGIIRVSGPKASHVALELLGKVPAPRQAQYMSFFDEEPPTPPATARASAKQNRPVLDQGIALYFPAPHSFTGEEVLELQGHGGPVILDLVLKRIVKLGVRLAKPGEFSERAFLNNKLDLAQAEAIADLIDAASEQAARCAVRSLQGEFSEKVTRLVASLTALRVYVEASIDFPEEEIDFLADGKILSELNAIEDRLERLFKGAQQGALLQEGMNVVIAGLPNAGKSSLLNRLATQSVAIVTDIPGTTRDVLKQAIHIDGMPLHIIDTAGLRLSEHSVEKIGIERALNEILQADRVLLVIDSSTEQGFSVKALLSQWPELAKQQNKITLIRNKCDLSRETPGINEQAVNPIVTLSAKNGTGIDLLRGHLKAIMGYNDGFEGGFTARRRHLQALKLTMHCVSQGKQQLIGAKALELLAEELRQAQMALGEITGDFSSDDLLGEIFSSFCIGK